MSRCGSGVVWQRSPLAPGIEARGRDGTADWIGLGIGPFPPAPGAKRSESQQAGCEGKTGLWTGAAGAVVRVPMKPGAAYS